MAFTSLINWAIERVAYRPLRGSFRLAPLISAIGMSIFLSNLVQVTQGPRNKSIPPMVQGEFVLFKSNDFPVTLSYKQLIIWGITAVLLVAFWYLVAKTPLGRAHRTEERLKGNDNTLRSGRAPRPFARRAQVRRAAQGKFVRAVQRDHQVRQGAVLSLMLLLILLIPMVYYVIATNREAAA